MGAGISVGPLTPHRQTSAVPEPTIAPNIHEALDVHRCLSTQGTLNFIVPFNLPAKSIHIVVVKVLSASASVDPTSFNNLLCTCVADSVDVREGDLNSLPPRKVYASDTCHFKVALTLPLLMLRITRTNNAHHAVTADDLTVLADRFNAASDLHFHSPGPFGAELSSLTSMR